MTSSSTSFSPSVYNAEEALLQLGDTFLKPNTYSTLKSGFLGYMIGSMARIAAESVHHRNILWNENFLNTASLPSSIYNFAQMYNYNINMATPASCKVLLGLYIDELQNILGGTSGTITIPNTQTILFGSIPFIVNGAINITLSSGGAISAEYDLNNLNFPQNNSYIRIYSTPQVVDSNGTQRIVAYLEIQVFQASLNYMQFPVISTVALDTSFYLVTLPTDTQLANFTVYYQPPGGTLTEIPAYFNSNAIPSQSEYCFYSLTTNNELEIYFSPLPDAFRPVYNSTLQVNYFTTTGAGGNFTFTGTPVMTSTGLSLTSLVELITSPSGGINIESLKDTKINILNKLLERNSIITEQDLTNYLSRIVPSINVNESSLAFIKRQDDIITRLFAGYLLLKSSNGFIVPTNTGTLDIDVADLESRGWSLPPGTIVIYDRRNSIYRLLADGEYPDQMINDPNSFVYCIPFLMKFSASPVPKFIYYRNQADIDVELYGRPGELIVSDNFIANSVTIKRNSTFESIYQIDISIASNISVSGLESNCIIHVNFLDTLNNTLGYVVANNIKGTNVFRAIINTSDSFDDNGNLLVTDCILSGTSNLVLPSVPFPEAINIKFELFYNSNNSSTSVRYIHSGNSFYQLTNIFQTKTTVSLFKSLLKVMYSDMHVTSAGTFNVKNVPLIGANFFLNPTIGLEVISIIEKYQDAIHTVFNLLQNNTSVDLKLYNTYGPSTIFNSDRTNLSIDITIKTPYPSDSLKTRIRTEISNFINNSVNNPLSRFSVSNLSTYLEKNILEISYIQNVLVNGIYIQNIEHIYSDEILSQNTSAVPEYLNTNTVLLGSLSTYPYTPDVKVNFI
jgi:hypothetical protein